MMIVAATQNIPFRSADPLTTRHRKATNRMQLTIKMDRNDSKTGVLVISFKLDFIEYR